MSNQEFFNVAWAHLSVQKERSFGPGVVASGPGRTPSACLYRCGKLACAVGCAIPDDKYFSGLEDMQLNEVKRSILELHGVDYQLLLDCQYGHDTKDNWDEGGFSNWKYLSRVAKHHGLDIPE